MPEFDHHSTEFGSSWRDIYRRMRGECPIARTAAHGGYTVLSRYEDVRAALLDHRSFACGREVAVGDHTVRGGVTIPVNPFRMGMMEMDPPESQLLRKLLTPWFSAKSVEATEPHIRILTDWCLDRVIEQGRLDIVDDLANPLPALVTLDLLGLPLDQWHRYASVLHKAAYRGPGSAKAVAGLIDDLRTTVRTRRKVPAEVPTPLDSLIASDLGDDLVVELVFMLLNGGIDTSTALIAHAINHLVENPSDADRLRSEPSLLPRAVHEFVRYFSPGTGVARTTTADLVVGTETLRAGERVLLALGSANLDANEFDDPDRVLIDRPPNRHLGFGTGMHRCLGSFLAPLEIAIVIERVLARLRDLTIDTPAVRRYPTIPLVAGFIAMPATFTPGDVVGPYADREIPPARTARELIEAAELAGEPSPTVPTPR